MIVVLIPYLGLGLALGAAYFWLMWHTVRLHMSKAPGLWIALLYALRLAGAGVVLWLAAKGGAWPLLATFAGFLVSRLAASRLIRRMA